MAASNCAQRGHVQQPRRRDLAEALPDEILSGPKHENGKRRDRRDEAPAKAGKRPGDTEAQERTGQQTRPVPIPLAHTRIAEHDVQQSDNPTVKGLKVEDRRSALEPVPLHHDAIGEPLEHPVILADLVNEKTADRGRAGHEDERDPRNPDHREGAAKGPESRGHRHQHGSRGPGNRPSRQPHPVGLDQPPDQQRRGSRPGQHGEAADCGCRCCDPKSQQRHRRGRGNPLNPPARGEIEWRGPAHGRGDARPQVLPIPPGDERPAVAGEHGVDRHEMDAGRNRLRSAQRDAVDGLRRGDVGASVDLQHAGRRAHISVHTHRDRRAGRPIGRQGPAVAGRRQVEEPGRKVGKLSVGPRHDR